MLARRVFYLALLFHCAVLSRCVRREAVAHLNAQNITGSIYFTEFENGIRVHGTITGLTPGLYGFHVHELGDTSTCDATGPHFNPDGTAHGGRDHSVRHVGDFGNVQFVGNVASVDFLDDVITFRGRNSILGRGLVLHEQEDDLGLGNHETSLTTGNAGPRVACGTIGISSPNWNSGLAIVPSLTLLNFSLIFLVFK